MNGDVLHRIRTAIVVMVFAAGLVGCSARTDHAVPHTGLTGQPLVPATASASASAAASASPASPGEFDAADVSFAQMMIPHHQQALAMAALAPTRADDPRVKELAAKISTAQRPEIATMNGLLKTWGKPAIASSGMAMADDPMHGMMSAAAMNQLSAVTGADFDRQFLTMMVAHHAGGVDMANDERARGRSPAAKQLAASIVTSQRAEIATMEKLLTQVK
jgi:uncharacterized protein (DUF305 family)